MPGYQERGSLRPYAGRPRCVGQEGKGYLPVVLRMSPVVFRALAAAMAGWVLIAATCTRLCQGWDSFVLYLFFFS